MAKKKDLRSEPEKAEDKPSPPERSKELCHDEEIHDTLLDLYKDIAKSYEDQARRSDDIMDYWDLYNCVLGTKQFYAGNSKIFVPIVHDAMNARAVRFTNQIFPQNGRSVEVITEDGTLPHATMALLDHYIRKAKLRTEVIPALIRSGDVEGQYTVYVDWRETKRHVVWKGKQKAKIEDEGGDEIEDPDTDVDDLLEETIVHGSPTVEIISDVDLSVIPATASSIEHAIEEGGAVTIIRRWTKAKIKKMIEAGAIDEEEGEVLVKTLGDATQGNPAVRDVDKALVDSAGIKGDGRGKFALVYETWTKLLIDGEKRLCKVYYGSEKQILSCKRNPLWSDKLPIRSVPVEKVKGSFKGMSKLNPVSDFQIMANDAVNEAMDSAAFALMPIVMTDPEKNPRVGSMILSLAAIWETNPNDTKFVNFPPLWKDGFEIVSNARQQIMQTLSVNPASITQGGGKKKLNQAEISQEQQVDILTTADAVTVLEEGIMSWMLATFVELDHQYRSDEIIVRQYGDMGVRARMEKVPPIQFERRWQFKWFGVEAARSAQQVQQQIAAMNVLRGIPPQMYKGYELDMTPVITQLVENAFGPRLAPLVFKDLKSQLSSDPQMENELMGEGMDMPVHPLDDHQQHMQVHIKGLQESGGDPLGAFRKHLGQHQAMLMERQAMAAAQMQQGGGPGSPGGAGPGVAGRPKPGAQPMPPRGGQNPPGAVHQDQMQGPGVMPRRAG